MVVLYLDVPPRDLDVNVHPTKREVRLAKATAVVAAVREFIRSTLGAHPTRPAETPLAEQLPWLLPAMPSARRGTRPTTLPPDWRKREGDRPLPSSRDDRLTGLRPVAHLQGSLIVCEGANGLYLVDQHRAHERILYERLRQQYRDRSEGLRERAIQGLVEPIALELKPHEARRLARRLDELATFGIRCEWYGGHSFLVHAVPTLGDPATLTAKLRDVLAAAASDDDWHDHLLVALACRSALRKGTMLSLSEAAALLDALIQVEHPAVCPHGAPIVVHLSEGFLARQFEWK